MLKCVNINRQMLKAALVVFHFYFQFSVWVTIRLTVRFWK